MDQIPLTDYQNELQSLSYSPILGNRTLSKISNSQSQIPKLNFNRPRGNSFSANSVAKALSPANRPRGNSFSANSVAEALSPVNPRKRLFSETNMSPSKKESNKMSKKDDGTDIVAALAALKSDILTGMDTKLTDMEKKLVVN